MRKETLFISDLHLRQTRSDITRRFLHFLQSRARGIERLYILGDLFDTWVGDDDPTPPGSRVRTELRELSDSGTSIFFQQGNRDFLIGDRFSCETGVAIIDDYTVIDLYRTPTLLMHGDLLCTDDIPYLQFRTKARDPDWQRNVLSKPLLLRLAYARWYRLRSHFHKRKKSQEIMDVNPETVRAVMRQYQVTRIIHGHTHRPAVHNIDSDGTGHQRFVLAQWERDANVLCWDVDGYRIEPVIG